MRSAPPSYRRSGGFSTRADKRSRPPNTIDSARSKYFGCVRRIGTCATSPRPLRGVSVMAATIATEVPASPAASAAKPWYRVLYVQVLIAIVLGALFGWLWPSVATNDWIRALGDGFIKLIKMVIAPIIFCTVVSGIAHIQDAKKVGRIGVKA